MTIGTEELIVQAVERLLMQKKVKKLTVKDIVEECGITRQTFYYHFRDIPDLLKWVLERNTDQLLKETLAQGNAEKGLRCLFLLALNLYTKDKAAGEKAIDMLRGPRPMTGIDSQFIRDRLRDKK